MVNIVFVLFVLTITISIACGHLGLGDIAANLNYATGDLVPNIVKLTADFQSISIPLVGKAGYVALPFKTICKTPGIYDYIFCLLCNQDCFIVHNQHGGKCGQNPNDPTELTCVCAESKDEARSRDIHLSSRETCKKFLPPFPSPSIALLGDEIVRIILQNRLAAFECPQYRNGTYNESGCDTDCKDNHGVHSGGYCAETIPTDSRLGTTKIRHCECNPRSPKSSP